MESSSSCGVLGGAGRRVVCSLEENMEDQRWVAGVGHRLRLHLGVAVRAFYTYLTPATPSGQRSDTTDHQPRDSPLLHGGWYSLGQAPAVAAPLR